MSGHNAPVYMTPAPTAGEALTRGQAVVFSSGKVVAAGAGERGIGFVQQDCNNNSPASIAIVGGGAVAIAAGTIAAGAELKADANGHLLATNTAADITIAIAVESAVDNDVFAVLPKFAGSYT